VFFTKDCRRDRCFLFFFMAIAACNRMCPQLRNNVWTSLSNAVVKDQGGVAIFSLWSCCYYPPCHSF
jgi:hypothetical protein